MAIAEDESTAIIPGMPAAAIATGAERYVVPLHRVASHILDFNFLNDVALIRVVGQVYLGGVTAPKRMPPSGESAFRDPSCDSQLERVSFWTVYTAR